MKNPTTTPAKIRLFNKASIFFSPVFHGMAELHLLLFFKIPFEVDFDDKQGKYSVAIHFAPQFHALRHGICGDDLNFVRSLHKCSQINVSGGKTRAAFFLSHDQRFLLKVHSV